MSARSRTPLIVAFVLVVVVVAALLAAVLSRESGTVASPAESSPSFGTTVTVEGAALPVLGETPPDPAVGMAAPALTGTTYDGTPMSITPGVDGPLMVVFLAHWCPACNAEIPLLLEWQASGAIPPNLKIVGVSTAVSDQRPNFPPAQWLVDMGWPWPALADDRNFSALEAYGGDGFPFFVFIGADGLVTARGIGQVPLEQLGMFAATALA